MRRRRQRGIALVLVTWVFMILGVVALDFSRYMRDDGMAALNLAEETRNYYIAVAGMNRAIYDLEQDLNQEAAATPERGTMLARGGGTGIASCTGPACARRNMRDDDDEEDDDEDDAEDRRDEAADDDGDEDDEETGISAADGEWREDVLNGIRYGVRVSDEGGLISLNDAAKEPGAPLLRHVVKNLLGYGGVAGIDRRGEATVATVVDSIVDWRDADDEEGVNGAESRFYLDRDPPYAAKNSKFDSIEELLLVRGMTPELYYGANGMPGLKDILTPYAEGRGDHPKVSLRRMSAPVLQALLGIDAEETAALIELREEQDAAVFESQVLGELRALDPALADQIFADPRSPKVVRIEARADVSAPRNQARVLAVIELASELTEGIRIIRWFDRAPWQGGLPTGTGDRPA